MWSDDAPTFDSLVESGRRAVLTCTCGMFGCGGASARIDVNEAVTWSDFHHANDGDRVDIGPFTFDRVEYDGQLAQFGDGA